MTRLSTACAATSETAIPPPQPTMNAMAGRPGRSSSHRGDRDAAHQQASGHPAREVPVADEQRGERDRGERAGARRRHQDAEAGVAQPEQLQRGDDAQRYPHAADRRAHAGVGHDLLGLAVAADCDCARAHPSHAGAYSDLHVRLRRRRLDRCRRECRDRVEDRGGGDGEADGRSRHQQPTGERAEHLARGLCVRRKRGRVGEFRRRMHERRQQGGLCRPVGRARSRVEPHQHHRNDERKLQRKRRSGESAHDRSRRGRRRQSPARACGCRRTAP